MLGAIIVGIMIGSLVSSFVYDFIYSYANQELRSEIKKTIEAAYKEGLSIGSVKHYLTRFHEICKEQVDSMASMDRPSVSAAFSRHRNNVIQHLKSLEKEKITLCKAIIATGADPVMHVQTEEGQKQMKMSELLTLLENNQAASEKPDNTPPPKTESKSPRKTLKLIVNNGDKMTPAIQRFIELERKKSEIKKYFEQLQEATEAVAKEIGIGGHFQDNEGIVYQIVIPEGRFVHFDKVGYQRTKREGEARGELSVVKAKELGYSL